MSKKFQCIPPKDGWEKATLYEVIVKSATNNPKHVALLYSGFLHDGFPSSYSCIWGPISGQSKIGEYCYVEVVRKLDVNFDTYFNEEF